MFDRFLFCYCYSIIIYNTYVYYTKIYLLQSQSPIFLSIFFLLFLFSIIQILFTYIIFVLIYGFTKCCYIMFFSVFFNLIFSSYYLFAVFITPRLSKHFSTSCFKGCYDIEILVDYCIANKVFAKVIVDIVLSNMLLRTV